jgi:cardiolipin synthase
MDRGLRRVRAVLAVAAIAAAAGCQTIGPAPAPGPAPSPSPAAVEDSGAGRANPPRVATSRGPLDPRRSAGVVARAEKGAASDLLARHLAAIEHLVEAPLRTGNAVRILVDGPQTHAAMRDAIARATDHVNLGTYIFEDDALGAQIAALLIAKRARGVRVNLMVDGVGSISTPRSFFESLEKAGIAVCLYNPVNPMPLNLLRANNRNHRKILVVDGRTGFTGGINISSVYASGSFSGGGRGAPEKDGWRDTHLEARGPVVADLQKYFLDPWREQCGEPQPAQYFPRIGAAGDKVMRVIAGEPGRNEVYAALLSAFDRAEQRIWLTVGYFVPDPRMLAALTGAARRGVDVRLALPGVSDFWAPLYAGRSHYDELLAAGVRIWERHDSLLHAKTAVVDSVWSTIGSTNLDWRSFVHNAEANAVVLGTDFGRQMERMFERDVDSSVEITHEMWARRGVAVRVKEWMARRWEYLL